jgi:hypothetical protein
MTTSIKFYKKGKYRAIIRKEEQWIGITDESLDKIHQIAMGGSDWELDENTKIIKSTFGYCIKRWFITEKGNRQNMNNCVLLNEEEWGNVTNKIVDYFKNPCDFHKTILPITKPLAQDITGVEMMRLQLGRGRYAIHSMLDDEKYFHFQQVYDNEIVKGITLNRQQWYILSMCNDNVKEAFSTDVDFTKHLGCGKYISVNTHNSIRLIHIRQYWNCKDGLNEEPVPTPTKTGVTMSDDEWTHLSIWFEMDMRADGWKPCYDSSDHSNQEVVINCHECTPWFYY